MGKPIKALMLSIAIYVVLAYIYALVKTVWCDEIWAMIPSANLAFNGFLGMGDQMVPPEKLFAINCEKYIFWFPPLSFISMGAWFKVVGYNILTARWHTIVWGVVLLCGIYKLSECHGAWVGVWAVLICALDYSFLGVSTARQDIMCAALGIWAISTRNQWLSALACMVHPFGVLYAIVVAILEKRLNWVPYVVVLAFWGVYIAQAPDIFMSQLVGQLMHHAAMERQSGVYLAFGTGWRLVLLATYVGCAGIVASKNRNLAICLGLLILPAFFVHYTSVYMAHAVPWLALCVAIQMRRYPWLGLIIIPQMVFVVTTLMSLWGWNGSDVL